MLVQRQAVTRNSKVRTSDDNYLLLFGDSFSIAGPIDLPDLRHAANLESELHGHRYHCPLETVGLRIYVGG